MIDADAFRCALDQDRYDCIGECESVRFRCDEVEKAGCDDECSCEE
jgi:phenylpropionate dioxygenase-like ring-hydroxylating dioxygenase large terminal subunit